MLALTEFTYQRYLEQTLHNLRALVINYTRVHLRKTTPHKCLSTWRENVPGTFFK